MQKRVLFVCTHNSARSQMAEGMLRAWAGDRVDEFSAGTQPTEVRSEAIAVMAEIGIDISGHRAKPLSDFAGQEFGWLITVCDRAWQYLFEDKPDSTFARIAGGADADVVVCGHTHRPYTKEIDETLFVNVGSAGKPKDGNPRACWALVQTSVDAVSVEFRRVAYDVETAAQAILASDLPDAFAGQLREARGYVPVPA